MSLDFLPIFLYALLMLASASYATRRGLQRPFARVTARDRRLGHKLSMGLSPAQVARLEGMGTAEVETLLADPGFASLAEGYRALHAMSEDEQRRILTQLARHLLMEATALGDVRVATYILLQERMGKDPARTLADGVIAGCQRRARAAAVPGTPGASPRPAYPSDDPDLRAMQRVEERLQAEFAHEHAVVHAAVAADNTEADPTAELADESGSDPDPTSSVAARQDDASDPAGASVEPTQDRVAGPHRSRRSTRPNPRALPSYEQARAIDALIMLRDAAPDEPPTPRGQAP
jgi:hypothetical protein